ncbi:MAG TPA: methyltransferase domain-containing protein [Gaiellaceae bacterium]|nr:methyltransferase domain-containing protein [Gaiellaceae bacterium]
MTFGIAGDSYDRFMGRYSRELAPRFVAFAGLEPGMRALDVGCGSGLLTAALADRLGATNVAAADPSESLLAACADRVPGADVRQAPAERLPWPDESFDAVLSQLVLNFVSDADAAVAEMCRVAVPGGIVASCTWDYGGGMQMLRAFWDAAVELDPLAPDESGMRYRSADELAALWERHGLDDVGTAPLDVEVGYDNFDDYWEPFTLGVGPAGTYCASLEAEQREALRESCFRRLGSPAGPFALTARAFAVRGAR